MTLHYSRIAKEIAMVSGHYSQIHCILLCVLQTLKEFWVFLFHQSFSGPLRKQMFTWTSSKGHVLWFVINGFLCVLFVWTVFQGLLLVIVFFQTIIVQNNGSKFLLIFLTNVYPTCKNDAISGSFPWQKLFIINEQTYSKVDACNNLFHITINFRNRHIAEGEEEEFEDDDEDDTVDYSKSWPFNFQEIRSHEKFKISCNPKTKLLEVTWNGSCSDKASIIGFSSLFVSQIIIFVTLILVTTFWLTLQVFISL